MEKAEEADDEKRGRKKKLLFFSQLLITSEMATNTSATTATRTNKSSTESPRSPSMALLMAAERETRRGGAKETETSDIYLMEVGVEDSRRPRYERLFFRFGNQSRLESRLSFAIPLGGVWKVSEDREPSIHVKGSKKEARWRGR